MALEHGHMRRVTKARRYPWSFKGKKGAERFAGALYIAFANVWPCREWQRGGRVLPLYRLILRTKISVMQGQAALAEPSNAKISGSWPMNLHSRTNVRAVPRDRPFRPKTSEPGNCRHFVNLRIKSSIYAPPANTRTFGNDKV